MGIETEKELLHEVGQISGKMDLMLKNSDDDRKRINEIEKDLTECSESTKSAHKRLDDYKSSLRWNVGIAVSIASVIVGIAEYLLGR